MNRNQKIVIFIGLILFLCNGVFVPYDRTEISRTAILAPYPSGTVSFSRDVTGYNTVKTNKFLGYFPIFNPPFKENRFVYGVSSTYESNINILRLIIHFFVLLILTIGLVLLFADKKNMGKPASKKE